MLQTVIKIVTIVLPQVLSTVVGLFEQAESHDAGLIAGLVGEGLARVIPDRNEDEIGRFLVAVGDSLVKANAPVEDPGGSQ